MNIIYPFNNRLQLGRAHDLLLVKTCFHLAKAGHRVYLIVGKTAPEEDLLDYYGIPGHPELRIIQLPILRRSEGRFRPSWHAVYNFFCLVTLLKLKRSAPFHFIVNSEIKLARFLLKFRGLLPAKFVYEVHGVYAPYLTAEQIRPVVKEARVYQKMDGLITTTEALLSLLQKSYGLKKPMVVVPLAADLATEPCSGCAPRSNPPQLFYFGQLYPLQGVDILIAAMKYLPQVELNIIGGKLEEMEKLRLHAAGHGLEARVKFHGFLKPKEVLPLAKPADVLVIPARHRGKMPWVAHTKVYEYLALGRPIVATRLPSIEEVLCHGKNAILVEPEDAQSMAKGVQALLSDANLAARLSAQAYQDAQAFTWEKRAERLTSFLEKLVQL